MYQESGLEQRLREIRRKFEASLPGKAERVEDLWRVLQTGWNEELAKTLYAEVHRLHGSCGTLGFGPVSDVAREIQLLIKESIERQNLPDSGGCDRITELVGLLSGNCGCNEHKSRSSHKKRSS